MSKKKQENTLSGKKNDQVEDILKDKQDFNKDSTIKSNDLFFDKVGEKLMKITNNFSSHLSKEMMGIVKKEVSSIGKKTIKIVEKEVSSIGEESNTDSIFSEQLTKIKNQLLDISNKINSLEKKLRREKIITIIIFIIFSASLLVSNVFIAKKYNTHMELGFRLEKAWSSLDKGTRNKLKGLMGYNN